MTVQNPYLDEASPQIRFWATKYQTKFNEEFKMFSIYGYSVIDQIIAAALSSRARSRIVGKVYSCKSATIAPAACGDQITHRHPLIAGGARPIAPKLARKLARKLLEIY